jgi:hypothetical protein
MSTTEKAKQRIIQNQLLEDAETEIAHYTSWLADLESRPEESESIKAYIQARLAEAKEALETVKQIVKDMEEEG